MASWSEDSSYQGAAQGAAAGTAIMPGWGTAIGAGIGYLAGGLTGGASEDAARRAEELRQKKIQEAIDRQNKSTFEAKRQAEQWALSDIGGINDRQTYLQAEQDIVSQRERVDAMEKRYAGIQKYYSDLDLSNSGQKNRDNYVSKRSAEYTKAKNTLAVNEGIIANYEPEYTSNY